jgi:hypothetical protein
MQEIIENSLAESPPKRNRGWFQPGDRRINRDGRPLGSKKAGSSAPEDRAPSADRLKLLVLPAADVAYRLTRPNAPWIINLPWGFEIVSARVDGARGVVVFVVRSKEFPRIARGAPIPEFTARLDGLRWKRGR